ncbi:MAG: CopD family protein [Rickettsiales bacterium]
MQIANYYELYKVAHVSFVIFWMMGMLVLPLLFAIHAEKISNQDGYQVLLKLEYIILKYIINPSMIITTIFGFLNAYIYGIEALGLWFHIKFFFVLCLYTLHMFFVKCYKNFTLHQNKYSKNIYYAINIILSVIIIIIVSMVIVKPFD